MKDWQKLLIAPSTPILETLQNIDSMGMQIALVVDANGKLLGTVSDGDIRRGIIKGMALSDTVDKVMNHSPVTSEVGEDRKEILKRMKSRWRQRIPVIDSEGRVVGLSVLEELLQEEQRPNWVLLMAGGLGTRLKPLTDDCPKPLLQVGGKPILETTLLNFIDYGFRKFYLSVNYKAEMIEEYFGNGSKWGVKIEYLRETERLGTAGCLGLLPEAPTTPLIVMNGDLLTKVNFPNLLDFHNERSAKATMCIREYDFQVPYGVVRLEDDSIMGIDEKPVQKFFVNGGIYVLDPEVLNLIPQKQFFDMPSLFGKITASQGKTAAFPIREYWLDIGQMTDFERANGEFAQLYPQKPPGKPKPGGR